jgi:hypothetical protein
VADFGAMVLDQPKANRDALTACAALGGFFVAAAAAVYLWRLDLSGAFPRDGSTLVVGRDFLNFWMYGQASAMPNPGQWYDAPAYDAALGAIVGPNYPGQNLSYPPTIMLLTAPFGRLAYLPALALWTLLGLAVFVPVVWRLLGDRRAMIAVMCSPAAIFGLISGQICFLTTAMLIAAFRWLDRRPISAGILIGFLSLKPHLGVLVPIMLIVSQRWRVFFTAAASVIALMSLSVVLFGVRPWIDYVDVGLHWQNVVMIDPEGIATPFFPTLFMNLRGIGATYSQAMALQFALAIGAAAVVAWAFKYRSGADPKLLMALFLACGCAALPYMLAYDTLPLCVVAMALLVDGNLDARGRLLARLVFWLPLIQIGLGTFHIPGPALIAPAFAAYVFQRLRNDPLPRPHAVLRPA